MNTYNEDALAEVVSLLRSRPASVAALAVRFGKSERTIKRWIEELRERGHRVVRDGVSVESPYCIIP